ncbi:MAG: Gfo/Idh/MocA family oxidoreductase [Thermaceae bacterium]|nr:Gfo/Idh/MocA family oxidoreductase [Thermaceae bacterium]
MIGAGRMGWIFARALAELMGEAELRWVVSRSEGSAQKMGEHFACRFTTELDQALADPSVDAVIIATTTPSHAEYAIICAQAGKPYFVEKPIADSLENGRRMVQATEQAGIANMVGFHRRYDPAYALAKAQIDAGNLGQLEVFRSISRDPDMGISSLEFHLSSGGLIVDLGVHDMDLARWMVGEVSEVVAWGGALADPSLAQYNLHDTAVALLKFENGALGTVEMARRTAYGHEVRTEVLGEKGKVDIERDQRGDLRVYSAAGGHFDRARGFEERFAEAYRAEIAAFIRGLRASQPLTPTVREGWYSLRLAVAAQQALTTGQMVKVNEFGGELW